MSSQMDLVVENPPANADDIRDSGLILGSGRSEEGNGNALQYSSLENSMDRGVCGVAESWTRLKRLSMHTVIEGKVGVTSRPQSFHLL